MFKCKNKCFEPHSLFNNYPNQIIEIRNIIKEIGKEKTVILSTHIMQEVEALCSRVILIHQGNILQDSNIEEFKGKFASLEEAFASYTQ